MHYFSHYAKISTTILFREPRMPFDMPSWSHRESRPAPEGQSAPILLACHRIFLLPMTRRRPYAREAAQPAMPTRPICTHAHTAHVDLSVVSRAVKSKQYVFPRSMGAIAFTYTTGTLAALSTAAIRYRRSLHTISIALRRPLDIWHHAQELFRRHYHYAA